MLKLSFFRGLGEAGPTVVPLFGPADRVFEKTAAPGLLPDVARYISALTPRLDAQYVLVNAMGATEWYGSNVNGDSFPEASLIHRPDNWTGNPLIDRLAGKSWSYGFPTFYNAHAFAHHRNKDAAQAFGDVELAAWNPQMKRVELVVRVDQDKCQRFGGTGVWDKLRAGSYPDVSMGTRVPYDTCSICLDRDLYAKAIRTFDPKRQQHPGIAALEFHKKLKQQNGLGIRGLSITRQDYCAHARGMMNRILPDGRKVWVDNDYPRFFDISFVFIGADKTAKTMLFISSGGRRYQVKPSAEMAEDMGVKEPGEKTAISDLARRVLTGAALGAVGGAGYHGFVERTPEVVAGWQAQALDNMGHNPGSGNYPDMSKAHKAIGYGNHRQGSAVRLQPIPEQKDVVGRLAPISIVGDARKHDLPGILDTALKETGRTISPKEHASFMAAVEAAKKPWYERSGKKTASIADELLKNAFLGKKGTIDKDTIPSQFTAKAIPMLAGQEPRMSDEMLDGMSRLPMPSVLSTTGSLGMVLQPREFQRLMLLQIGQRELADQLDQAGQVFGETDQVDDAEMGPRHFMPALADMLAGLVGQRSGFGPVLERRIIMISTKPAEPERAPGNMKLGTSVPTELFCKLSAAYNGYRRALMDMIPHSPALLKQAGHPAAAELAETPVDELFTTASVQYFKTAHLGQFGVTDGRVIQP